jgi:hypothetical protein
MAGSIKEKESVVGNRAQQLRGLLALNYPMGSHEFSLSYPPFRIHRLNRLLASNLPLSKFNSGFSDQCICFHSSEHGVVTDWHDMEHIWQSVYKEMEITPEDVRTI